MPEVDKNKIGILGFSWGGVVSMLSRERENAYKYGQGKIFAAHVAYYPICWVYNKIPEYKVKYSTLKPILILTGSKDDYDMPNTCQNWKANVFEKERSLVNINVYQNAYHGFNATEPEKIVTDPYSHLGKGGKVIMKGNTKSRNLSNKALIKFL